MGKDFVPRGGRGGSRGGRGGFGRGGGGQRQMWDQGPPAEVIEVGNVMHPCQEYVVVKHTLQDRVPIFNRPIYLENKTKIGVIDDVFGPINEYVIRQLIIHFLIL
jgi:H/ACA ribonucleoprotein complex subunit 1